MSIVDSTCKILVPIGAVGGGIAEEEFKIGLSRRPDAIACDAGSTDSGPSYLGTGQTKYAREAVKEDMRIMIVGGNELSIPVLIGSCGTCGSDMGVDQMKEITLEICKEERIKAKIACIYTEQAHATIKKKLHENKIRPLAPLGDLTESLIDECDHIVALAGAEPFIQAIDKGATIILCGRATDTAMMSALPLRWGLPPGPTWHAAKTVECGAQCTSIPAKGSVLITVDKDGFTVEPTLEGSKCTPYTVSAHMLYENANPYKLVEPSGTTDTSTAIYKQLNEVAVRVEGTSFYPAEKYTMKLEGSGAVGFQTITLVGIRDPEVCAHLNEWSTNLKNYINSQIKRLKYDTNKFSYDMKLYGYNAILGEKIPDDSEAPREVMVLFTVTGDTQEMASKISKLVQPYLLHFPYNFNEQLPSFAFPFSPSAIDKGAIYEFKLNHVVELDDPLELVRIEYVRAEFRESVR
ncbi:acyclic terpene utilization AtuA family protein [Leptospira andrefontaineae]|uniref:Acyclic terpene utilization AtuA family protein n=1 Tax=Leptospira andrefontaineae TaxID=2484976 RepID=A0A4V3JGT5_9LEPT|nr:acyclic terpene utilization AtuA family protein [Leptospira andrefontaineae]TGK44488.1 acyclic terpene utilization AtuA family protein [Leptospira andrefontaineae]